jgi:hypothetical protein
VAKRTKKAALAGDAVTGFLYDRSVMASTAPTSPGREIKVDPEPKRIKQFEMESSPTKTSSQHNETAAADRDDAANEVSVAPDHEAISRLAYGFWLDRAHSGQGSAEEDWYRAERELRSR